MEAIQSYTLYVVGDSTMKRVFDSLVRRFVALGTWVVR